MLLCLIALRRCGSVRVLLRFFDRVLQLLQTSGRVPLLLFFYVFLCFSFDFRFSHPLSHALSPLPPWIVCRYVFSVNWSSVQLHLRCNGVSTLCVPMLDICRVLQNLLPTLRTELTVHPFKISPQNPQKIELAMLMQCLFAIGRQRVPQFLSNASNHLCHCIFDVTLSVCHSI